MPELVQCVRCGAIIATGFTDFISWHITEDGQAICPHCLTPAERRPDAPVAAADPEAELLAALDPDNEQPDQGEDGGER